MEKERERVCVEKGYVKYGIKYISVRIVLSMACKISMFKELHTNDNLRTL